MQSHFILFDHRVHAPFTVIVSVQLCPVFPGFQQLFPSQLIHYQSWY